MKNGNYVLVKAPEDYPGRRYRGRYCYAHHLSWWAEHKELPDLNLYHIHHKDHNGHNNDITNLVLVSAAEHRAIHIAERKASYVITHGGYSGYKRHKCRCAECMVWWATFKTQHNAYRKELRKTT